MVELRPYQVAAKEAVLKEWDEGRKHTLLVQATGTGKTVVFSAIAKTQVDARRRVLIMAHRGELLEQAADKLKSVTGLDAAVEKAEQSSIWSPLPVTIGSVQTLTQDRRLERFKANHFNTIIVDEAHHCLSKSYKHVLEHFSDANVLGVTATPDRGDMKDLSEYFDSLAYEYNIIDAIHDGYLCPVKAQMIPLKIDMKSVRISNGDYALGGVSNALEPYLDQIAHEMAHYCRDRKTVVFLPLIAISQKFCDILNSVGFHAAEINGNSPNRAEILADFESGKYNVLCNSMLLTEGWDCPSVDCIVVLRPTKIRSLYQQMVGRGTRIAPNKKDLLLLDFLWLTEKHDLCKPSSLIGKNNEIAEKIDEKVTDAEDGIDILKAAEGAERDILKEREDALRQQLKATRDKKRKLVDPLQYALSIAAEDLADYTPTFDWEFKPSSEKQLEFLEKRGISTGSVDNKGLASKLIDRLIKRSDYGLTTPKQIKLLERYGFQDVGTWQFDDASKVINRIAANGWKVPYKTINPATYRP